MWGEKHGQQVGVLAGKAGAIKAHWERYESIIKEWRFLRGKSTLNTRAVYDCNRFYTEMPSH